MIYPKNFFISLKHFNIFTTVIKKATTKKIVSTQQHKQSLLENEIINKKIKEFGMNFIYVTHDSCKQTVVYITRNRLSL